MFHDAPKDFPDCQTPNVDEKFSNASTQGENVSPYTPRSNLGVKPDTSENRTSIPYTPPPDGPYKRRKLMSPLGIDFEPNFYDTPMASSYASDCDETDEATEYRDVLLLFRFNDHDLPFEFKKIIVSDLRLPTFLEAGLPSWVIFCQSYPVFCHVYRPWMCPLARALYVVISVVTVVIGFYDLYKNVPVLKATASRLCGPLFDWIETWEMVSRIKYLGTMLFLHDSEKAVMWFLMMSRSCRLFVSIVTQPLAGPFYDFLEVILPVWNLFVQMGQYLCSFVWIFVGTSWEVVENLVEVVLVPVWFILSIIWGVGKLILLKGQFG